MIRLSEQVRRLEDTIESLRRDNKKLRDKLKTQESQQKEFMITYKWEVTELPTEWNKEWDMYTILYKDRMTGEIIIDKWIRYKNKWRNPIDVEHMISDERDEIIDHQNHEIAKLKKQIKKLTELNEQLTNTSNDGTKLIWQLKSELLARVKQVEDLQDTLKKITKENERLKSKLEQTVDEYDEEYKTFHKIKDDDINYDKRLKQHMRDIIKSRLDDMFNKWRW